MKAEKLGRVMLGTLTGTENLMLVSTVKNYEKQVTFD